MDIDLAKFFDTVNHDVRMNLLARSIADERLLQLIGRYRLQKWGYTFGGGRRILASASITGRSRNWTSGSGGVCVCATGNSGVWPRTKVKNFLVLGVSLKSAIQHGCSSNSYWQMSRTPVIN